MGGSVTSMAELFRSARGPGRTPAAPQDATPVGQDPVRTTPVFQQQQESQMPQYVPGTAPGINALQQQFLNPYAAAFQNLMSQQQPIIQAPQSQLTQAPVNPDIRPNPQSAGLGYFVNDNGQVWVRAR